MPVVVPSSLDAALALLREEPSSMVLAGGTDLMVQVNEGVRRPERVLALNRIADLRARRRDRDVLVLGAATTYSQLMEPDVAAAAPALAQAARTVGSPQIRNAGTLGGNLATASPAGDTLPVLRALGAIVELACSSPDGVERRFEPVSSFLTGPKLTGLRTGELIVAVHIPVRRGPQEYLKVGVRNAMVIAVASVALVLDLDARAVGVALGSVGPTALDASAASEWVAARLQWEPERARLDDPRVGDEFAARVAAAARPIDDHRGRADYRRHAIEVLARRALRRCTA